MLTGLLIITSGILNHEISHLHVMWISGHSIQWNSFGLTETPDDDHLRPKHVVHGRSDVNSCIVDRIILCVRNGKLHYLQRYLRYLEGFPVKRKNPLKHCEINYTSQITYTTYSQMKQTCLAVVIHMYIKYNSMLPIIMCKYVYTVDSEPVFHALVVKVHSVLTSYLEKKNYNNWDGWYKDEKNERYGQDCILKLCTCEH
jgi:hypothetical protein